MVKTGFYSINSLFHAYSENPGKNSLTATKLSEATQANLFFNLNNHYWPLAAYHYPITRQAAPEHKAAVQQE